MGGIVGAVAPDRRPDIPAAALTALVAHRGPDGSGIWSDERCVLGHRRLAVIDLSDNGLQPMANGDRTVCVVFDGAIYNFTRLRTELESLGHRFRTRTDTETIVRAYEQWGLDCLARLGGMFALAIWDGRLRRLVLARDRVGKKPLYYTEAGGCFRFASELQAIVADPAVPREVNLAAVDGYLAWGYVPGPQTAFRGIWKLPPAHRLVVEVRDEGLRARAEPYWALAYEPKLRIRERDAAAAIREKLTEAVRIRLTSDVPLGALLSGGIDSSIVVGLMAGLTDRPVRTYSVGFEEIEVSELAHARRVARRWGTEHHEFVVRPDPLAILPRLVRHFGEPFADSSAVPTYYLSQITRTEVTVALGGDGGDESFAGYRRYYANRLAERMRRLPAAASVARTLHVLLPDGGPRDAVGRLKRFLSGAGDRMAERYGAWVSASTGYLSPAAKQVLYSRAFRVELGDGAPERWLAGRFAAVSHLDPVDAAMAVDVQTCLPHDLLMKVDIATMAHGLEVRSPFLDHEVMELAARLPVGMKLRRRRATHLLRRAFADLIPAPGLARGRMGFGVPVGDWFRGPLRPLLHDVVLSTPALARGYFGVSALRRLVREHVGHVHERGFSLWSLLMLELWHREFIDRRPELPDVGNAEQIRPG
jgi:asparagine synthase (glutamine-hydrolysing)